MTREINEIIVHCTATRPDWWEDRTTDQKVAEVKRWHVEDNKWADIGYTYLIDRDGTIAPGRPIEQAGAHTKGHNAHSIGIALFGGAGSNENDQFDQHYTAKQNKALRGLIAKHGIEKVSGHNEYAAKACPGFRVSEWLQKPRTNKMQSTTLQATMATAVAGAGGVGTAIGSLDSTAQYIVTAFSCFAALGLLWIARERINKWAKGDR